ncbi:uncharacterized protein FIESC28_05638 [Fusarium coffeatum]|uniref:Uncharacterized protein n=1 Tax=Fusarium coffeatum TaxID=231269 RepID=A0A366RPZ4_9HYPO|nr:uncharacterized protein FIESC28_05638 [Fusarium coffeatum]RBR19173.1 hypothetical protein FIESC28_05638 [Fusarium coffeatum]
MPGARRSRPSNSFLCVIADQCPDDTDCNKSFPTIEKHNEHLKRCHSSDFWCLKCLHKFNCSLPAGPLRLAKKEHEKTQCPGVPSQENKQLWNSACIMTPEQYDRFKDRGWKKTHVSNEVLLGREKESVPQTSWRRIRETIFPGSEAARENIKGMRDVMDRVKNRSPLIIQPGFQAPRADAMQPAWPNVFPPSLTTDDSQLSITFSEGTDFETRPSSRVWSHSGGDEQHQLYRSGPDRPPTLDPSFLQIPEELDERQTSELVVTGEYVLDPIPPEVLWHFSLSQQQEGTGK